MWTYREFLEIQQKDLARYEEKLSLMNVQKKKERTERPTAKQKSEPEDEGIVFIIDR